jgi:hypothetical protein
MKLPPFDYIIGRAETPLGRASQREKGEALARKAVINAERARLCSASPQLGT